MDGTTAPVRITPPLGQPRPESRSGISPGDRAAAFGANSDAFAILFLACASMGAVHVPVNFALKGEELRHILRDADVVLIAADPALLGLAEETAADVTRERGAEALAVWPLLPADEQREVSVLETASEVSLGEEAPSVEIAPENLAQLLYTSGTTSAPKGAMMTHRALVAEYLSAIIALDLCAEDRPLVAMPPDERWGEAITAVIVVHPDQQLTAETVRRHARERLADYKVPKRVEFVAELPRNQSGKLLKRELRAQRTAPSD